MEMRNSKLVTPNYLTALNLFCGFFTIIQVMRGEYIFASWLIIIAAIIDGLDGKLARYMGKGSHFGMEFDSISDIVSFGVAPAFLIYTIYVHRLELWGVILAFSFLLSGGYRLARYNVLSKPKEKGEFSGLPIPVAAISFASFVVFNQALWDSLKMDFLVIPLTIILGALMVSKIPYDTLPKLTFKEGAKNKRNLLFLIGCLILIAIWPALSFFPLCMFFVTYGVARALVAIAKRNSPKYANGRV
jgi:CDP-diacylglycerol--serine O-phosphatidyltransferase